MEEVMTKSVVTSAIGVCAIVFAALARPAQAACGAVAPSCRDICTKTTFTLTCDLDTGTRNDNAEAHATRTDHLGLPIGLQVLGKDSEGDSFCCDSSDWGSGSPTFINVYGTPSSAFGNEITCSSSISEIVYAEGGGDNDLIETDGPNAATFHGLDGHDQLYGGPGNDKLYGEDDEDLIYGGAGTDTLYAGSDASGTEFDGDNNWLYGESGTDTLYGSQYNPGADYMDGGTGVDNMYGRSGNDLMCGGDGNDTMYGDGGNDRIGGWWGTDTIDGGGGTDDWCEALTTGCEDDFYAGPLCPGFPAYPH